MIEFGFKSDTGMVRDINQDYYFILPDEKVFLIADGVGGHNMGELASRLTISQAASFIRENPIPADAGDDQLKQYFSGIVQMVNEVVHHEAKERALGGMATTLVLIFIRDKSVYVVNVGDSRVYLERDHSLMQVTRDHTFVNDLVDKGIITESQARIHPDRNMITRAIGAERVVEPDFYKFEIFDQDIILMCTDGLYNEVPEDDIVAKLCSGQSMREAAADLVDSARRAGGHDNITVVTVKVLSEM